MIGGLPTSVRGKPDKQKGAFGDEETQERERISKESYRLLVHDKLIQPVPQEQISQVTMKHKLAIWASKLK